MLLADCYAYGIGTTKNKEYGFNIYCQVADQGNAKAIYKLAVCYDKGNGVNQDAKKAFDYYQKAADLEYPDAIYKLAVCYDKGNGVNQDTKKAFDYYQKAADLGDSEAIYNLAVFYDKGIGVYPDKKKAFRLFKLASDFSEPNYLFKLAVYYETGGAVKSNFVESFKLFSRAADLNHPESTFQVARYYYDGVAVKGFAIKQDRDKAFLLFKKALNLGYLPASFELATCYYLGVGTQKDFNTAFVLFKQADELGILAAKYNLGLFYESGMGTSKNPIKALECYLGCLNLNYLNVTKTTTQIKKLISLKPTRDDSYKLYGAFEEIGLVRPFDVKKGNSLGYNLGNMLHFHAVQKKLNDESSSFDREGVIPSKEKYALYSVTSYGAELFESFVSKLCSEEESLIARSKNINNNDVNVEEIPFKVTKIPTGFMLTNIQMSQDLTTQLTIDRLAGINDSVVSVMDLSGCTFYNIGLEAVKLMEELVYFKDRLTFAKNNIEKLIELETAPELIEHLRTHHQFAESLEENLGWAFAKSAGPRNKDFAEFIGWGE